MKIREREVMFWYKERVVHFYITQCDMHTVCTLPWGSQASQSEMDNTKRYQLESKPGKPASQHQQLHNQRQHSKVQAPRYIALPIKRNPPQVFVLQNHSWKYLLCRDHTSI